jgi:hypothetical protein
MHIAFLSTRHDASDGIKYHSQHSLLSYEPTECMPVTCIAQIWHAP